MRLREKFSDVGLEGRPTLRNFKLAVELETQGELAAPGSPFFFVTSKNCRITYLQA
jgi:hypothetical protein